MPRAAAKSTRPRAPRARAPKVGFVSLGCPKALVDSERILTQLRAEGYEVEPTYEAADVVVVNTCGFIDAEVDESLDAIGEALEQNGRVIVTGCLGAKPERILERHPRDMARHHTSSQSFMNIRTTSDMPSSGVNVIHTRPPVALVRVKPSV